MTKEMFIGLAQEMEILSKELGYTFTDSGKHKKEPPSVKITSFRMDLSTGNKLLIPDAAGLVRGAAKHAERGFTLGMAFSDLDHYTISTAKDIWDLLHDRLRGGRLALLTPSEHLSSSGG